MARNPSHARHFRRHYFTLLTLAVFFGLMMVQDAIESAENQADQPLKIQSRAYAGHDHDKDKDMANAVNVYPELIGTVLDDCRLCHCDGIRDREYANHCDFCHAVYKNEGFTVTLNPYGTAYAAAGRSRDGLKTIETADSDGDGVTNIAELKALTQPGEADSKPGLAPAPTVIMTAEKLASIPRHSQFLLLNAHRVSDVYATYSGWRLRDILKELGSIGKATHITAISHDGFKKDYSMKDILDYFPRSIFYGNMDTPAFLGDCPAWVVYPDTLPLNIETGKPIPDEQRLMLADRKNGIPLETIHRSDTGRLEGEGPFRMIMPQRRIAPPDQSMLTTNPDWPNPFDESLHHNSGDSARGVIAIAVHPLPEGTREPDWRARADELLQSGSLMIFGAIEVETPSQTTQAAP